MFSTVVLKNTVHILHQRHDIEESNKDQHPKETVDSVKKQETLESDFGLNQSRSHQRKCNKNEDIDTEGENETASDHPGRNLGGITFSVLFRALFGKGFFGGKAEGSNSQNQSLAQDANAAGDRGLENLPFLPKRQHDVFHDSDG